MDAPQKSLLWLGFLGGLGAFGLLWYSSLSTGRDKISDVGKQRRSRTTGATSPQGQHEAESPTAQALLRTTRSRSALNHSPMANSPRQEQQDLAQDETEENTRDLLRDTHEELVESEKVLEALLSLAEEAARKGSPESNVFKFKQLKKKLNFEKINRGLHSSLNYLQSLSNVAHQRLPI
jgi:hypothetical protein